jgi:small-conductance mechanosensitive channel
VPGTARSASLVPILLFVLLVLGGGVLLRPAGALAQAAAPPPAASTPRPPAAVPQDSLAALDGILATLKNDTSRAAFVAELERLRTSLAAQGQPAAAAPAASTPTAPDSPAAAPEAPAAATPPKPAEEAPPQGGLLGAVAVGLTDVGQTVRDQVNSGTVYNRVASAASQAGTRLSNAFRSGDVWGFLLWALSGWGLALAFLYGLRTLPWLRPRADLFHADKRAAFWRTAGLEAVRRLIPWVPAVAIVLAWPALLPRSGDAARIFLAVAVPFLMGSFVIRIGGPLLYLLGPVRGWRIVRYAERRILPWIGALAALSVAGTMLRAPDLRWTLGWDVAAVLTFLDDAAVGIVAVLFILNRRRGVRRLLAADTASGAPHDGKLYKAVLGQFAANWHLLGLMIVVGHLISRVLGVGGGSFIGRALITLAAIAVVITLTYALSGGLAKLGTSMQAGKGGMARRLTWRYLSAVRQLLRLIATVLIVIIALRIWNFDAVVWFSSGIGLAIARPILSIAAILLVGWITWIALDTAVDYALLPKDNSGRARDHSARARTLLPLLRNFAFVVLVVLTVIAILSNLGVNVTLLLGGVSIFGLALGFGSQQLVQDVITGLFMLFEDTIAVGDTIDTGDRNGTVESVTIRTVRIRDGDGALHTIPFSQIKALKNRSRGLGVYTVKVVVGYDADLDRVMDVMREVGQGLRDDPAFASDMLTGLEIWGVDQFTPEGITIMGGLKTRALKQWGVGRAFNLRLKQRFDQESIPLTPPRPSLMMPSPAAHKELEQDIGA